MSEFLRPIMATPLLIGKSDLVSIREELNALSYSLRDNLKEGSLVSEEWDQGIKSSNKEDFYKSGVTSFNSIEDLFHKPEWKNVSDFIFDFSKTMINTVNPNNKKMNIINMWTTIYPPGAFVPEHVHSSSYLSGVFYSKAPKNCGDIVFHDPSWVAKTMFMHTNMPTFPNVETKHSISPEEGLMVIFPSWLPHRSLPNNSTEDRIIVSFNIGFLDETNI
jgi:uncharacterized protein (TIGR02466 family)